MLDIVGEKIKIITQCFINEESLDYLLFKKLPMNVYSKKFTKSTDLNRQPNSCVAWKVHLLFMRRCPDYLIPFVFISSSDYLIPSNP